LEFSISRKVSFTRVSVSIAVVPFLLLFRATLLAAVLRKRSISSAVRGIYIWGRTWFRRLILRRTWFGRMDAGRTWLCCLVKRYSSAIRCSSAFVYSHSVRDAKRQEFIFRKDTSVVGINYSDLKSCLDICRSSCKVGITGSPCFRGL
jgi:hypothetical protein